MIITWSHTGTRKAAVRDEYYWFSFEPLETVITSISTLEIETVSSLGSGDTIALQLFCAKGLVQIETGGLGNGTTEEVDACTQPDRLHMYIEPVDRAGYDLLLDPAGAENAVFLNF